MRVGAIDVGTNSVHLVVADLDPDGNITVIEKQKSTVALGEGGMDGKRLSRAAMARCLEAMRGYKDACDSLEVADIHCAATSAVREAENGVEFCRKVKAETGIHVRIITGLDEAEFIYLGARPHLDFSDGPALLVDLGGGSTEFILCDAHRAHVRASLPLGHLRATSMHRTADPMTKAEVKAIRAWVRAQLAPLAVRVHPGDVGRMVGTSGTIRCLARMATLARGGVPTENGDGLLLWREEVRSTIRQTQMVPAGKLSRIPGMDDKRKETLPAGAIIVDEIMRFFEQDRLVTSAYSLRDGLLVDWVRRNRPELERSRSELDPRRRSVLGVMDRYCVNEPHSKHVADMALQLFDITAPLHRLRLDDRRLLEFASLLHDVGHHISGEDHHKHGQYLIRHTRMSGFTAPEIDQLGLIVRYHRGKVPKRRDLERLDPATRHRVRVLAGLIAVADGLDRGRDGNVQEVRGTLDGETLTLRARSEGPAHLERWAVNHRKRALEHALGITLDIHIQPGESVAANRGSDADAPPQPPE